MKSKFVIALSGTRNVGKSTTLRKVFALLTDAYPNAAVQITHRTGVDVSVIIEINGIFVGIESHGDPVGRLPKSIEGFRVTCSIIICATRTKGRTVTTVKNLQPEFKIIWHKKTSEPQSHLQTQHDLASAQAIFNDVQNALNAS